MNNTLHLLFKFHEVGSGEFEGIKTMEEHIKVMNEKGKVIWGHFTTKFTAKGLWDEKTEIMDKQIKNGEETLVFFCDKENELLYVGRYLKSYKRADIEIDNPLIEFIPEYYHNKVGTPTNFIPKESRSYAYVVVQDIKKIDFKNINKIFTEKSQGQEQVLDNGGMSSKFYVRVADDLYDIIKLKLQKSKFYKISEDEINILLEENYQYDVENEETDKTEVNDEQKVKPEYHIIAGRKVYVRDSRVGKNAIVKAAYKCEVDNSHEYFISKQTHRNYVEAHHLVPMEYQDLYINSIDVEANVISICPCCHKLLHHGRYNDKLNILKELYNLRKERLNKCGIDISYERLIEYYK